MCECELCQYIREFEKHLEHVPDEHKEFFNNLLEMYLDVDMDKDYYRCIVEGSWPTADEIIAQYRQPKETPPHCTGHKQFEYNCIDCLDALETIMFT
jgi:hypothetical protein